MNEFDCERHEPREMTPAEEAWALWANSQDVDTAGKCDCGHEGLGLDWHLSSCPATAYLLASEFRPPRPGEDPPMEPGDAVVSLLGSDGEVIATARSYPGQSINFADLPATTITGFSLTSAVGAGGQRVIGSLGASGEWTARTEHDCDTPDEGLINEDRWTCPDCTRVWELHTEYWWAPADD